MIESLLCRIIPVSTGPLWAASTRTAGQADTGQMLAYLIGMAAFISTICAVLVAVTRYLHKRRTNSHAGLFAGLCKHHGLDRSSRGLLVRIARHWRLKEPGRLFIEPQLLDPARLASVFGGDIKKIAAMQMQLFASGLARRVSDC